MFCYKDSKLTIPKFEPSMVALWSSWVANLCKCAKGSELEGWMERHGLLWVYPCL